MDYQQLYHRLFNGITDAVEALGHQNYGMAKDILIAAQCDAEDLYINMGTPKDPGKESSADPYEKW